MSKLDYLTIGIVAICIAALIFLVYRYVNLPHSTANTIQQREVVEKDSTPSQPQADTAGNPKPDPTGAVVEAEVNSKKAEPLQIETTKPVPSTPKPSTSTNNNANSEVALAPLAEGRYMVIAGSFKEASGAKNQLRKIQKAGYPNARVEKFNRGTYATVLVNRFPQASSAKALVDKLKSKGFDAMVLEKR